MHINRKGLQFSRRDTWDNSTLAAIIVKWLQAFKRDYTSHPCKGCPFDYIDVSKSEHTEEEINKGQALFMADIDEMIWAFSVDDMPEDCWLVEPSGEGIEFLGSGKLDYEKIDAHRQRKLEGMRLFAEKFGCMWI